MGAGHGEASHGTELKHKAEGHRDTGGLQRGRVSPQCPGLLPERGRSHGQTHKAGVRSCGEGRASGSGRLVLGVWTPAQLQLRKGVPSLRAGGSLSGRRVFWKYSGAAWGPKRRPPLLPPTVLCARVSVTPHKETPAY